MIIQHTTDKKYILLNPEDIRERRALEAMPGFLRQGLNIFIPNKQNVLHNVYSRIRKKIKNIKYTKEIKELLDGDLKFKDLPDTFKFHTTPLTHQFLALRFAYTFECFGLLLEPGLGKTKVILDYIWLIQAKKSLIVCPKPLRFVWEDEAKKHRPELSVYVVETTDWNKELPGVQNADVIVVNYDKAVSLLSHLERSVFDFIGVDEGLIKNHSTDRTKAITKLSKGIRYRSIMSGTLVNNSPLDIFAPVRMLEPALVGEAYGRFKEEFSIVSRHNKFIVVGYKNIQEVKDILSSCSIIMKKEEWLKDLPPKEFKHIYVQMGDQQRDYYQRLANNYLLIIDEIGAEIEVDNPLTVLIKLTQISNGFLYYKEDLDNTLQELYGEEPKRKKKVDRKTYFFEDQPKARALLKLIASDEFNRPEETNTIKVDSSSDSGQLGTCSDGNGFSNPRENSVLSERSRTDTPPSCDYPNVTEYASHKIADCNTLYNDILRKNTSEGDDPNRSGTCHSQRSTDQGDIQRGEYEDTPEGIPRVLRGDSATTSRRAIIWFNMAAELDILQRTLSGAGITFITIAGGDKAIGEKVHLFNKDSSYRFLLCQAKTINYGVTIMGSESDEGEDIVPEFDSIVSDEIFYSLNFSLEVFLQQQDRIHRIGQKRKCRYWMLLTNSPIERRIAERLEEKLLCNKEILIDIAESLDLENIDG